MQYNAVKHARETFNIETFPGDLFDFITSQPDYVEKYKLIIFKEDLDKLSGFIGYEQGYAFIGINYKRPIGHQNLTLAHELGHLFMHKNRCFSDVRIEGSMPRIENEAFQFGMELLYPQKCFLSDMQYATKEQLFIPSNYAKLAIFINSLCCKYFLSFDAILRRMTFYNHVDNTEINKIKKEIDCELEKVQGIKYTHLDANFHISQGSTYSVKSNEPYQRIEKMVKTAEKLRFISPATAESILLEYDLLEDD